VFGDSRSGMPVLMFHGLADPVPEYALFSGGRTCLLRHDDFSTLIDWCASRYDLIRLEDLDRVISGEWSGRPPLLLTFDDGLASVVDLATPVLRAHGASAVVFVTTEWTDTGRTPEIFGLERRVWEGRPLHLVVTIGGQRFESHIDSRASAERAFSELWKFLFKIRFPPLALGKEHVLIDGEPWIGQSNVRDRHFWETASWNELKAAVSEGVLEIGSHMLTHQPLTWLSDGEQLRQLQKSQEILSDTFGYPITACAYPHGFADRGTESLARDVYRWSFTTHPGLLDSQTRRSAIPRYHVPGENPAQVRRDLKYGRVSRWLARAGL